MSSSSVYTNIQARPVSRVLTISEKTRHKRQKTLLVAYLPLGTRCYRGWRQRICMYAYDAFLIHVICLAYPLSRGTRFSGVTSICASFSWLLRTHVRCTHRRIVLHLVRCVYILHGVKYVSSLHAYL